MKLSKTITTLLVLGTLSFSQVLRSEEIALPKITAPQALQEGIQRELTPEQISELLPWAKNSKAFLVDLLENIQGLSAQDKVEKLLEGIKSVVPDSAPKKSELFMRYALNRGLVLYESLSKELDEDAVGTVDAKLRVLTASINMSLKYYSDDFNSKDKKGNAMFAVFGVEYFEFLHELNKSVFDASAQYVIQRTALEWLQWDLYRDLNNTAFAPQIVKINNGLKTFQTAKVKDAQAIVYIRRMKKISSELNLRETLVKVSEEERARVIVGSKTSEKEELETMIMLGKDTLNKGTVAKNDLVYYFNNNKAWLGRVVGKQDNGHYTIRFSPDSLISNISRSNIAVIGGCNAKRICTDDKMIYVQDSQVKVKVLALEENGRIVVEFIEGKWVGQNGIYDTSNFAATKGCNKSNKFCVGTTVVNTAKNADAVIIGIQEDDKYVLEFTSGNLKGKTGSGWEAKDLMKN